ncbi:MAG TPA: acyl carrier protein [Bryobacteraceae bacterium]|nr:acyl carrier protein [Bryobacteraceae bacterium]
MASQPSHARQDSVTERVLKIIADNQKKDVALVTIESSFEELNIDSMDAVNIVFALENEFNVNVPDEEMKNIRSVRDIVEGMHKLVEGNSPDGPQAA